MAVRTEKTNSGIDLIIDGWEQGIQASPYKGIANIRNLNTSYYPGVAYVNYKRQGCTMSGGTMTNPVQQAVSPVGLIYILDDTGQIFKQSTVNSSTFAKLVNGTGRQGNGSGGLAYWNNYLVVFGDGMIEFCGDGSGDGGVTSANWNLGVSTSATVNPAAYDSLSATIAGVPFTTTWGLLPHTGDTSLLLTGFFNGVSGTYPVTFGGYITPINITFTNGSNIASCSALPSATYTTSYTMLALQFSSYSGLFTFNQNDPVVFTVISGALPTGITAGTTYYLAAPVTPSAGQPIIVSATANGAWIPLSTTGSGSYTMTDAGTANIPIKNQSGITVSWSTLGTGSTAGTLNFPWNYASGLYNMVDSIGDNVQALLSYNSVSIAPLNPTVFQPTGTYSVNILNPGQSYRCYNSKVDGYLYFTNGRWIGRIAYSNNINAAFNPALPATYSVSYAATGALQEQDIVVDMTDLRNTMVFAGQKDIYPWDYVSAQPSASSPVGEQIVRLTNLLNNIYILAGTKGNIYVSNGYSAQIFTKIPDYISGIIDPAILWGDLMVHRSKLFFQALLLKH
jgi:hypothetical protein